MRGKGPVAAVPGTAAVGAYDSEMVRCARDQAADVRTNTLIRVPGLGVRGSCGPVAGRSSVLKTYGGAKSVRINYPVQCR
jgi:hypothetical protein